MFAFCIWDQQERKAFIARDRVGIKPIYYALDGETTLTFASEIKGIYATGLHTSAVSSAAMADYLTLQFVLGSSTLFEGVQKLEPGHYALIDLGNDRLQFRSYRYWDIPVEVDESLDETRCVDRLAELIEDSIRLRLRSDVSIGAHLSGGLDSTTIVSIAKSLLGGGEFNTFTGYFAEGPEFTETEYARIAAEESNAIYNEILISGDGFADFLPKILHHMDEPAAGPGIIPQYFVSAEASKKVKVILGGQGGDELFIGYARYLVAYLEESLKGAIFESSDAKKHVATLQSIIESLPVLKTYTPLMQKFWARGLFDASACRYFRLVNRADDVTSYLSPDVLPSLAGTEDRFRESFDKPGLSSLINKISNFELTNSLTALLQVEDRTSMASSIESRVPLLDHRIVEFMFETPPVVKFKNGKLKYLFLEAIKHKIPRQIFNRKNKMGFPVPLQQWYVGHAKDFVRDTLLGRRAKERGLYNVGEVEKLIDHEATFSRAVWGLLCLELWHQMFIDKNPASGPSL